MNDTNALLDYLVNEAGYCEDDFQTIDEIYEVGGIEAAVDSYRWADDAEHDYSGELRAYIELFEKKHGIRTCGYPVMKVIKT